MKNKMSIGEFLKEAYMIPLGISNQDLSKALDVSPATVSRLVTGRSELSVEMAVRLSKAFSTSADQWLAIQNEWSMQNINVDTSNVTVLWQKPEGDSKDQLDLLK